MIPDVFPDIPVEVKRTIVSADLQVWVNTRFQLQMRHRVNKSLKNDEAAKSNVEELVKIEETINEYRTILHELDLEERENGKVKA